ACRYDADFWRGWLSLHRRERLHGESGRPAPSRVECRGAQIFRDARYALYRWPRLRAGGRRACSRGDCQRGHGALLLRNEQSIGPERLIAMLSGLFGALAAMLVAIGLYGLLAYTVTRRMEEIGLRIAIGASGRDVIGMVLTSALGLVSVGLIIGVPMALWMKGYAVNVLATLAA